jgi:hypothetical protein
MALVPLAAGPASAAPPPNDESGGAVAISLGDHVTQDTTEATTNAGDATLNANCGAPATNASVWYQYTSDGDRRVALDMSSSSYSGGLMVFKGTPTANSLIACGPGAVGLHARPGKTYFIMAFSDTEVNGGTLVLSLENAPTPRVHVSVAKHGVAFHGGAARIHGSYYCKHADSFNSFLGAFLFQRAGRLKIQGEGDTTVRCNGKRHHWSARIVSPIGTYAKGHAVAKVQVFACGLIQCRQDRAKRDMNLTWAKNPQRQRMVHPSATRTGHPHPVIGRQRHWPSS